MKELKQNLQKRYPYLTDEQISTGCEELALRLVAIRKFNSVDKARRYVFNVLQKLLNESYRMRFSRILMEIDTPGIALSLSFRKSLRHDMVCQWSILNYFSGLNYERSSLRKAVHNSQPVFHSMPQDSILTLTA